MSAVSEALKKFSLKLDHRFGWHRLPVPLGLLVLGEMRDLLRERNLHDTGQPTGMSIPQAGDPEAARYLTGALEVPQNGDGEPRYKTSRMIDGTYNDLEHPLMGAPAPGSAGTSRSSTRFRSRSRGCSTPSPRRSAATCIPATSSSRRRR